MAQYVGGLRRGKLGTRNGFRVDDLFCGAGGFAEGFRQAGYEVLAGSDVDPDACSTRFELSRSQSDRRPAGELYLSACTGRQIFEIPKLGGTGATSVFSLSRRLSRAKVRYDVIERPSLFCSASDLNDPDNASMVTAEQAIETSRSSGAGWEDDIGDHWGPHKEAEHNVR